MAAPAPLNQQPRRMQRGFTLVEAVTVIAIMAILTGIGSASFVWLNQSTSIRGAAYTAQDGRRRTVRPQIR